MPNMSVQLHVLALMLVMSFLERSLSSSCRSVTDREASGQDLGVDPQRYKPREVC